MPIKINKFTIILIISVTSFFNTYSQEFNLKSYFYYPIGHPSWVIYDYKYIEFDYDSYQDSSIVLESFIGELSVGIDESKIYSDTTHVKLQISKKGIKTRRTFFDTLSIDTIDYKYFDSLFIVDGVNELGGNNHIYGWIFHDSLAESVKDTSGSTSFYPYSKLYCEYYPSKDDSLFSVEDTLYINYRPIPVNINESYYSFNYKVISGYGSSSFSRYYNYYGQGFNEKYKIIGYAWTDVEPNKSELPTKFSLSQNYPNPFNPSTTIKYSIPNVETLRATTAQLVTLKVYDILGREVATLVNKEQKAGNYEVKFDAEMLNSGIYFYQLRSGKYSVTKKMLLLK